jgi:hypothetical protein
LSSKVGPTHSAKRARAFAEYGASRFAPRARVNNTSLSRSVRQKLANRRITVAGSYRQKRSVASSIVVSLAWHASIAAYCPGSSGPAKTRANTTCHSASARFRFDSNWASTPQTVERRRRLRRRRGAVHREAVVAAKAVGPSLPVLNVCRTEVELETCSISLRRLGESSN